MDRLIAMKTFVQVVDAGNFAGAARSLRISPGAVSKHISQLEHHLGVRLFRRTTRSMALTEEGEIHAEQCRRWLQELEVMEETLRTQHQEPRGRLRVTAPTVFGRVRVMPLLLEYMEQYPMVQVQALWSDKPFALVHDSIDLAIRVAASLPDSSMSGKLLGTETRRLYASPSYLATFGTPHYPDELKGHRALLFQTSTRNASWSLEQEGRTFVPVLPWVLEVSDVVSLVDATLAGLGIAELPEYLAEPHVEAGTLKPILLPFSNHVQQVWLLQPSRHFVPRRLELLREMLVQRFPARS